MVFFFPVPMSTPAHNDGDNRQLLQTTGFAVAMLFLKKMFMWLLKLQLVSLLFFCPFSSSYIDMRNSTRTLIRCLNNGDPLCASTLLRARGVKRRLPGDDGSLLRRTLHTDWKNWTTYRRKNNQWKVFCSCNFHLQPENIIFALGAKVLNFET